MGIAAALTPTNLGVLLEKSGPNCAILFLLYGVSLIYAARRLALIYNRKERFDAQLMFVSSIVFNLAVRSLSMATLAVLAFRNIDVNNSGGSSQPNQAPTSDQLFYQRSLAVLFNIADWSCLSSYILLSIIWVEMMAAAKKTFYSSKATSRRWMITYITINTLLYLAQIGLYVAIFTSSPANPEAILAILYAVLGYVNIALPMLTILSWLSYALLYAGFPYRSKEAYARWKRLSRLVAGWTVARLVWAAASILAANSWALDALAAAGSWAFPLVVVSLFLLAELVPFLASLGTDVLRLFAPLGGKAGRGSAGSGRGDSFDQADSGAGDSERTSGDDGGYVNILGDTSGYAMEDDVSDSQNPLRQKMTGMLASASSAGATAHAAAGTLLGQSHDRIERGGSASVAFGAAQAAGAAGTGTSLAARSKPIEIAQPASGGLFSGALQLPIANGSQQRWQTLADADADAPLDLRASRGTSIAASFVSAHGDDFLSGDEG